MTGAYSVISRREDRPCALCGDTGWITRVDVDGSGWDIPCPQGCPDSVYGLDDVDEAPVTEDRSQECGPLSACARTGHVDSLDHQPGLDDDVDVPP